jgi:hypothetical protein
MQVTALLQLVVNKLKDSQSIDLLVLKEVIGRMTGVDVLQDMSDDQVREALLTARSASSPTSLQYSRLRDVRAVQLLTARSPSAVTLSPW